MPPPDASILAEKLHAHPCLAPHLSCLADRCDRRGDLTGRVKLGDSSLPPDELRLLRLLFGQALKTSAKGEHRLDLDRFLAGVPGREAWIAELYGALGRQRRNRPRERDQEEALWRRLLGQFRLAYPGIEGVHRLLEAGSSRRPAGPDEARGILAEWSALAEAVVFLQSSRRHVGLSELGARFLNDSKALRSGRLRALLCRWLEAVADEGEGDDAGVLARFGVADNPTSIKVTLFGPLRYRWQDREMDWPRQLHAAGESATLSLDNLDAIAAADFADHDTVVTCENETPFNRLIREKCGFPVIYTAGFPNAAVRSLIRNLPPDTRLLHWGDSDLAGYRIAHILSRLRPLALWRCSLADLERHRQALKPVSETERDAILRFLESTPGFPFAAELRFTAEHGWLEQESWSPASFRG
ncbi:MAG: DUF2399 domain-containing protein [Lentisphaeria bacterium]|jgi:hypothetical protein|nr:DUF2399 domain-containing protein [Lentisphaeria bacterium]